MAFFLCKRVRCSYSFLGVTILYVLRVFYADTSSKFSLWVSFLPYILIKIRNFLYIFVRDYTHFGVVKHSGVYPNNIDVGVILQ